MELAAERVVGQTQERPQGATMTNKDGLGSDARPITGRAVGVLLVGWSVWKLYKLHALGPYGFFSWQYIGATLLGVVVFLGAIGLILWTFESADSPSGR
jgi:hypothetical protein